MSSRPAIVVLGTGGTIAGVAPSAHDNLGYQAAQQSVATLLQALGPGGVPTGMTLLAEQVAQIDSKDMDFPIWQALAQRCQHYLQQPQVQGMVITHGTDTLEESAWFLHLALAAHKPVVLTCAMRPATALFADGPQNLRDALAVAAHAGAQGVVAVCAGTLHSAQRVQKVHPYRLDAFDSGDAGPLGWVEEGQIRLAQPWPLAAPTSPQHLAQVLQPNTAWPRVEIIFSHAGASAATVDALVASGVQGLVVAATGNGSVHQALLPALERAQTAGVALLIASRCPWGALVCHPKQPPPWPWALGLSPIKARISLLWQLLCQQANKNAPP
ncbi:MAG: asparaginase [Giesbergeria sp.]|uniref:asparaginase n=1 Tax=Giesbergeria sp. TaxID=2818473 RepID=UPI002615265A|nr:asparaginase [Giesbergeria sp.]MDD2610176.1 asparaginase [Giesbergeria sp.]